ncbi:YkvA family protein [Methylophaga sp. OBS4]|uniref:YkvA family protein n=1 Tax=Methylophaga sp. OBS4 TaxID=2991935 RepID=UPI00225211AD|nr:DUF1232 domain-containing protein [Methylophaga sp. OBS4]MCX4186544.1 DUF1232 domain-containing protein [Methylophaga sp. OBS4]
MPILAKIVIVIVVAYVLSPVDLIPDFIPVIGYLDDMLLLPIGIWLAIRLIPEETWLSCQAAAKKQIADLPRNRQAVKVIIFIWLLLVLVILLWLV